MRLLLCGGLLLGGLAPEVRAQNSSTNSLRYLLARTPPDSARVLLLLKLARTFRASKPDSAMYLAQRAWQLARQAEFDKGRGRAQSFIGSVLRERGELPKAFANQLIALQISRESSDLEGEAISLNSLGNISLDLRQYRRAIAYYQQSRRRYQQLNLPHWTAGTLTNIGSCYEKINWLDSALVYQQQAEALIARFPQPRVAAALALRNMGDVQARLGHHAEAFAYYRRGLQETYVSNDLRNRAMAQYHVARLFDKLLQPDSSLYYARQALRTAQAVSYRLTVMEASGLLARLHQARQNVDSAFRYQAVAVAAQDSLFGPEKFRQLQLLAFTEQQRQLQQREEHELQTARYQQGALAAAVVFFVIIALLLLRITRQQRRANQLLNERNAQIETQRNELSQALAELRTAQAQLVAAEKWAFAGELSAGIAHELQNPLAYMRNFASVSAALLGQDQPGAAPPGGLEREIMAGLRQNLHEISQHGQRASAIISDMLAHARAHTSQRQPTDLNALVSDNLRLAAQKPAQAAALAEVELRTELAPSIGLVSTVPQELGRALLNLFTNAFYAVQHRQRAAGPDYRPQVSVCTRWVGETVEIQVRDNGVGMSDTVAKQVFQPFFTTKPLGEGTGLGLSLAYDIITKGHLGTLTMETREGEFTEFTVRLPA